MNKLLKLFSVSAVAVIGFVGVASAATFEFVEEIGGNECGGPDFPLGSFGGNQNGICQYDGSQYIVKYDYDDDDDTWGITEFNEDLFGPEEDFGGIEISFVDGSWQWVYNADADDPGITAFAAKGSNAFNIHAIDGDGAYTGTDPIAFTFPEGNSHITFFDTLGEDPPGEFVIPVPAGLPLVLTGLGVMGALRLKKRKKA